MTKISYLLALACFSPIAINLTNLSETAAIASVDVNSLSPELIAQSEQDIVDTAVAAGSFSTLVTALEAAELVDTLKGEGPFTVFAPTDEAFAALPPGTLEMLLEPENKELLVKILTYHVVSGNVMSTDLMTGSVPTVEGSEIAVDVSEPATVKINQATVEAADIETSNGVIHVIDQVILPPDVTL